MKKFLFGCICLYTLCTVALAGPNFSFSPTSGNVLKLHCLYKGNIVIDSQSQKVNGFESSVLFDPLELQINHFGVDSFLNNNASWFINTYGLYQAYGVTPYGQYFTWTKNAGIFLFKTIQNITGIYLSFATSTWGVPTYTVLPSYSPTDDGLTINGYDVWAKDILEWSSGAYYSFDRWPCIVDTDAPNLQNLFPATIAWATKISWDQLISALLVDWQGSPLASVPWTPPLYNNPRSHYRYAGNPVLSLENYVAAPATVDNQAGVNSGTILVDIAIQGQTTQHLTGSSPNLAVSLFTGNGTMHRYTWDSRDRGYVIAFTSAIAYPVEKRVDVTISTYDNPNELSVTHLLSQSFSFNAPVAPTIARVYPVWNSNINPKISALNFQFRDDWAGIDTSTIQIAIPAIYSGADLLMTWHIYSWAELNIVWPVFGSAGLGNEGGYDVSITPLRYFPENTGVTIIWTVLDLAGTTWTANLWFTTRKPCSFYWCMEPPLSIFTLDGLFSGMNIFTWTALIVTWEYAASSYFTGDGRILYCEYQKSVPTLLWNIPLYIQTTWWNIDVRGRDYTGTALYITGLDFILSGQTIIIN